MKAGNRIRVQRYYMGYPIETEDFTVEEYYYCLGIFESESHRIMGKFTPLCELLDRGPDSKNEYMPNHGEYTTNLVQGWIDICK